MQSKIIIRTLLFSFLGAMACSQDKEKGGSPETEQTKEEEKHDHQDHGERENKVELTRTQLAKGNIQMGPFSSMNLKNTVKATGRLELPPQNEAKVNAMMGGMVKAIQVLPGEFVEKGQILAYLEDPAFAKLQENYLKAVSELEFVKAEYKRKKDLYDDDVGSEREFQKVQSNYRSLKAKVQSLASQLRSINIDPKNLSADKVQEQVAVKAPIKGYVRNIPIKMGQYVESQSTLFELVDNHHIHIDLMVYEENITKVKKGQRVLFTLANEQSDEPMVAEIFATGKALENDRKAVRMHAELKKDYDQLLPGMYVDARVIIDTASGKALPESGVVMDKDHHYIFYSTADKKTELLTFKRLEVNKGPTDGGYTQVKLDDSQLPENARLVTQNAHYLLREMQSGSGGGHSH